MSRPETNRKHNVYYRAYSYRKTTIPSSKFKYHCANCGAPLKARSKTSEWKERPLKFCSVWCRKEYERGRR